MSFSKDIFYRLVMFLILFECLVIDFTYIINFVLIVKFYFMSIHQTIKQFMLLNPNLQILQVNTANQD